MIIPAELESRLNHYPRLVYPGLPTPLERLDNLTRYLRGPQLWMKRDDGFGPGMGGNKGRKLAYLLAEARAKKKKKVVTFGGLQSNHARMTAAACAALGLQAHLFFFDPRPASLQGNLILDDFFGAELHFIPFGGGGDGSMTLETTNRLVRVLSPFFAGPGAYFMPVGGHTVTGCLGYVQAALECRRQVADQGLPGERTTIVTAAGTGGTLAGMAAGLFLLGSPLRVLGVDIGKLWRGFAASLAGLVNGLGRALGETLAVRPDQIPLIERTYAGPGYATMTPETGAAIRLMAGQEGIILDPVYTGKAFAGLLDLVRIGYFRPDDHVIFLHTGGLPGLWAYEGEF